MQDKPRAFCSAKSKKALTHTHTDEDRSKKHRRQLKKLPKGQRWNNFSNKTN